MLAAHQIGRRRNWLTSQRLALSETAGSIEFRGQSIKDHHFFCSRMIMFSIMRDEGTVLDHRRPTIRTIIDAEQMHAQILDGAARTVAWLRGVEGEPMSVLKRLRFDAVGHDPLTGKPLNVIEQLNQTFTIWVSLRAVLEADRASPGGLRIHIGARNLQRTRHRERHAWACGR